MSFLLRRAPLLLCLALLTAAATRAAQPPQNVILVTLDTTRSDFLGCYGARDARTPTIDALAARGTRYAHAIAAAPLTLPSHASLLTGLEPIGHGVHANGTTALPHDVSTLATALAARGFQTAAFVSSRVLDRRFGLARGFSTYDDAMLAEQIGEYGYPERSAAQVTDAALSWLTRRKSSAPFFLWIHYYDPHAPYAPPQRATSERSAYAGEIAYVDRELGRLLRSVPTAHTLIAVVGDHGEALGEHGEQTHGLLLQRSTLEVPLIISRPGATPAVVDQPVGSLRLAPTILALLGAPPLRGAAPPLPLNAAAPTTEAIYSETELPAVAYGWSPLRALTAGDLRLVAAPEPELFDWRHDPDELRNLLDERRRDAVRLKKALEELEQQRRQSHSTSGVDPQLTESLRSLGYLSGSARGRSNLDPKRGLALLAEYDRARLLLAQRRSAEAATLLATLVARSPGNVPFLTELGEARLASGDTAGAVAALRSAVELNPQMDLLHLNLADAYRVGKEPAKARAEYEVALKLNPRLAAAWLQLAALSAAAGDDAAARAILTKGVAAGTQSASILTRLATLESAAGMTARASRHIAEALRLAPTWTSASLLQGELAEKADDDAAAERAYRAAIASDGSSPQALLHLGRLLARRGRRSEAAPLLQRVIDVAGGSAAATEARKILKND